ncbi:nodulation protein NolU [Bradyrhizobium pachyrhizi]|uniref:nodulation protein NolU n=1 Tax=Bradyrhizobium pachyrhizi TaxID=280333 RepID=UPI0024B0E1E1|nr:nodulation protein NolU [Bradyrhizobium pachyrhizi]WFU54598.1 nodulation protein NolU [Bradyrhizobium pachyrhizi]
MATPKPSAERRRSLKAPVEGISELAASIHPTRLAACLDANLSVATLVQLQKSRRLQTRMAGLLLDSDINFNRSGWTPDLLLGHDPKRAAVLAGCIFHARSLIKLISKADVAVLIGHVGAEAQAFGIRHAAHAASTRVITDPHQLAQEIDDDGHACLGAWLDQASALDRSRVLLRLAVGTAADNPATEHRQAADRLFSLVLAQLAKETSAL